MPSFFFFVIGSFTKQITEYLTLSNPTNQPLAFKVKTTAPKLYCVRPNASVIEPGQSLQISIILQGFSQPLPSDYKCKDKFLLVSVPASPQTDASKIGELWPQLEAQNKAQVISKKLRVSYVIGQDKADTGATQNNNTNSSTTTTNDNSNNHAAQNSSTGSPLAAGAAGVAAGGAAGYAASNHSHNHNQQQQQQPPQQQSYQQQQQQQPPQQQSYQQQQQPPQHQSNNSFGGYNQNQPFSQNGGSSSYGQGSDYGSQNRSFNDTSSINNGYNGGYQQQQPPLRQQQSYSQGGYDSGFGNHQQQQQQKQQQQPQSAVQRELEALARQVQTLSTKLEEKNSRSTSGSGVSAIVDSDLAANGISLPIALVLILVAFLVGWLVF